MGKAEQELLKSILEELQDVSTVLMHAFPPPPPAREPRPEPANTPGTIPLHSAGRRRAPAGASAFSSGSIKNGYMVEVSSEDSMPPGSSWSYTGNPTAQIITFTGIQEPPEEGNAGVMAFVGSGGGGSGSPGMAMEISGADDTEAFIEALSSSTDLAQALSKLALRTA